MVIVQGMYWGVLINCRPDEVWSYRVCLGECSLNVYRTKHDCVSLWERSLNVDRTRHGYYISLVNIRECSLNVDETWFIQ